MANLLPSPQPLRRVVSSLEKIVQRTAGALLMLFCLIIFGLSIPTGVVLPVLPVEAATPISMERTGPVSTTESRQSAELPYWIWVVLPRLFPEYLAEAGGYLSLGFDWQEGNEVPIGIEKINSSRTGQSRERLNCAACHAAESVQTSGEDDTASIIRQAAFSHGAYYKFLYQCASDPRFTADYILPAIQYNVPMGWLTAQRYRYQWIPEARRSILNQNNSDHK